MAVVQTSQTYNWTDLATTTLQNFVTDMLYDQVVDQDPFLTWMSRGAGGAIGSLQQRQEESDIPPASKLINRDTREVGIIEKPGGTQINIPLRIARDNTVEWMSDYDQLATTNQKNFTTANFNWKTLAGSLTISDFEIWDNQGQVQIQNLLQQKIESLMESISFQFRSALYGVGGGKQMLGLQAIIEAANPPASNIGGIDRSDGNNAYWRNQIVNGAAGGFTYNNMLTAYLLASNGAVQPSFIVTDRTTYQSYHTSLNSRERIVQPLTMANAGFIHTSFLGAAVVVFSDLCPSNTMYFITKKGLKIVCNSNVKFRMTDFYYVPGSYTKTATAALRLQMVPVNPRLLSVYYNIA